MMMRRGALLISALLGLVMTVVPVVAQAPDTARLAAAKEMMQIAGVARQFDEVMPLLMRQLTQGFVAVAPDKADQIREVFGQLSGRFIDRKGELIDQVAAVYAEQLSLAELTDITTFYRSPAGMKFIEVQPTVMREAMALGQRWGAQLGREIEAEARRELKKRGIDL